MSRPRPMPCCDAEPAPQRARPRIIAWLGALACLFAALSGAAADPAAPLVALKPGQFRWFPEASPNGPVVAVVSLDEQRVYVYRNGVAIGVSTISSGRRGHETPEGTFTILQKAKFHKSDLYDDAPMPYMQRLTWDGVAMHAGSLPGYPASHGCIRLPAAFASKLFDVTRRGETIIVASAKTSAAPVARPAYLAPVAPSGTPMAAGVRADAWWREGTSSARDPLSILVALRDRRVYVLRGGELIAESPLEIVGDFSSNGSLVLIAGAQFDDVPSRLDPLWPRRRWSAYAFDYVSTTASLDELSGHLRVPADFARRLYAEIDTGTTVLVTNLPGIRAPAPPAPPQP
ncbi:L,D-transpeptidase [Tahibacter caeni]|uniref:L,D-transpeptidase n=1 Tax=Tahibacter caeni TaxID=1453545 RepID=UPI002147B47B|nr:L,D-transpeptidase [Tahibacter caeni]